MQFLILTDDGIRFPITEEEAARHANVSIGKRLSRPILAERGVYRVVGRNAVGVPESRTAEVAAFLDGYVFGWVERKKKETKAEAGRRILARLPDFKQRNYLAFSLEMTRIEAAGSSLTQKQAAMLAFVQGEWDWAQSVRSASDAIEARIDAMTDAEAGVFDVSAAEEWPQ